MKSENGEEKRFVCPYHSGHESEINELCRRCDEFKKGETDVWNTISQIRENCRIERKFCIEQRQQDREHRDVLRESEMEELRKDLRATPKIKTVLSIVSIAAIIGTFILGIWVNSQDKALTELKKSDLDIRTEMINALSEDKKERKELTTKLNNMSETMVEIKTVLERGLPRKGNKE